MDHLVYEFRRLVECPDGDKQLQSLRLTAMDYGEIITTKLINVEWNHIGGTKNPTSLKSMIKFYLDNANDMFSVVYNTFQNLIESPGDILYYLNPLHFKGKENIALTNMYIDISLDYSGFIKACLTYNGNTIMPHIKQFVERFEGTPRYNRYRSIMT